MDTHPIVEQDAQIISDWRDKYYTLKRELAALQAQSDKLAAAGQGLAEALMNDHALNDALETWDAALADWRTARENS